jgi:hypothetical protein
MTDHNATTTYCQHYHLPHITPEVRTTTREIGSVARLLEQLIREGLSEITRAPLNGREPSDQVLPLLRMISQLRLGVDVDPSYAASIRWARRQLALLEPTPMPGVRKCREKH